MNSSGDNRTSAARSRRPRKVANAGGQLSVLARMKSLQFVGETASVWARMIGASAHPEPRQLEIAASLVLAGGHVVGCDLFVFVRKRAQMPRRPPSSHYSRCSRTVFASPRLGSRLIDLGTISPRALGRQRSVSERLSGSKR